LCSGLNTKTLDSVGNIHKINNKILGGLHMDRLKEIELRKLEIRKLLEGNDAIDLAKLEIELKEMETEKAAIEKRNALLEAFKKGEIEGRVIAKPDDGSEKIPAEARDTKKLRVFRNFGEQLAAIKRQSITGMIDERQAKIDKECRALGMNTTIGSEGGMAIQTDFAGMLMESAATEGNILPLVDRYDISGNSDSVEWVDIDESSVATTVFGGVQVYWAGEAQAVTAKQPKFLNRELKLQKLMGVAYATDEMEKHSNFASDLYSRAFKTAINRELESCIISGNGVGKPLGMTTGTGSISVAKEVGQAADTVVYENIVKMSNRAINKTKSVWVIHPDVQEQLDFLQVPIGVGGVPVYLSASSVGTLASMKGRPIIETDHCAALGDLGDINFVDFSDYMMIFKGGLQEDYSIHVQFLTAQNCFRFMFYANGMPKRSSALTIKNSSNTRSSCVKLAERA
jgi:HK97 family phage major capsid protein